MQYRAFISPALRLRSLAKPRFAMGVVRRFAGDHNEFKVTDVTYRPLYPNEDPGLKTTKLQELDQGHWVLHQSGQPGIMRKHAKKNIGTGRGGGKYNIDYRLALPFVEAFDKFTDVNGMKDIVTFPKPPETLYLVITIDDKSDKEHILLSVLDDTYKQMQLKVGRKREKLCEEMSEVLAAWAAGDFLFCEVQEAPHKREGELEIVQMVQTFKTLKSTPDEEFQYLYHEEQEGGDISIFAMDDEGETLELSVGQSDGGKLWGRISASIQEYEETGNLLYITCWNAPVRSGFVRVACGGRLQEL